MSTAVQRGVMSRVRAAAWSDEALLERARDGDEGCFEALFRRHYDAVLGFCLLRLGDRQAAEDATQEVFLRVHRAAGAPVGHVKAWLFTVARNVVTDAARRNAGLGHHVDIEVAVDTLALSSDETAFSALDVPSNVFVALRRLSARDRKAIILREFQDRSSEEIGSELGMKVGAVDVALFRARAAFGRAYAEVAEMPTACREATEAIYREQGSGLTVARQQRMQAHLASCPTCAAEYRRAHSPKMLAGLVGLPWLHAALGTMNRLVLPAWSVPAKATLGAAVMTVALAPAVVGHVAVDPQPRFESALPAAAQASAEPARGDGGAAAPIGGARGGEAGPSPTTLAHETMPTLCEPHPLALTHGVHDAMQGVDRTAHMDSTSPMADGTASHAGTGARTGTGSAAGSGTHQGSTNTTSVEFGPGPRGGGTHE